MLRLLSDDWNCNCEGYTRREFLRVGALSLGGLTLPGILNAEKDPASRPFVRDKAVVMLNLQGGPSQHETFDPKMDAPADIRSVFGEIFTGHFGDDPALLEEIIPGYSAAAGIDPGGFAPLGLFV